MACLRSCTFLWGQVGGHSPFHLFFLRVPKKAAQNKKNQKGMEKRRGSVFRALVPPPLHSPRHWEAFFLWLIVSSEHHSARSVLPASLLLFLLFSHHRVPFPSLSQLMKTFKAVIKCHFFHGALQNGPSQNQSPLPLCTRQHMLRKSNTLLV